MPLEAETPILVSAVETTTIQHVASEAELDSIMEPSDIPEVEILAMFEWVPGLG